MLPAAVRALRLAEQCALSRIAAASWPAWRGLAAASSSTDGSGGSGSAADPPPSSSGSAGGAGAGPSATSSSVQGGQQEHIIQVDRSGLLPTELHSHAKADSAHKEPEGELVRHLKTLIRFRGGPLTLAEYMSEVLTNPQAGYYTQRDVFGVAGDFVTSPEISQMFGEMVGIWCVATWQQLGQPEQLRIVELGPGRGTLMADLLRGTSAFPAFAAALTLGMVEVSPVLEALQWRALRCPGPYSEEEAGSSNTRSGFGGVPVKWHRSLDEVDTDVPTLYLAHEFIDALPVHQFQHTPDRGWCERLVDVASHDSPLHLRLVLSPGPTPAARLLLPRRLQQMPLRQRAAVEQIEVCPQGMATTEGLAQRVAQHGGAALIIDYGQDAPYDASLQAIRQHQFVGLLEEPGAADLSARVDFSALRSAALGAAEGSSVACYGPITQTHFLLSLGIEARLQQLVQQATEEQAEALVSGFRRLVGGPQTPEGGGQEEGMGHSYKAICIAQSSMPPPVAFEPLPAAAKGEHPPQEGAEVQQQQLQLEPSPGSPTAPG